MRCPCCKKENREHPRVCGSCGYDPAFAYEPPSSDALRAARFCFVLGVLSFLGSLFTAIPAIVFGCIALRGVKRSPDRLKGRWLALAGIAISVFTSVVVLPGLCYLWSLDAPPIPNDYTIDDLRSAPGDCAESYSLLQSLCIEAPLEKRYPLIGLSGDDVTVIRGVSGDGFDISEPQRVKIIRDNDKALESIWNKTEEARAVVGKLAGFDEIADLTDPKDELIALPTNLLVLARLNQARIYLQIVRGDSELCLKELVELDFLARKLAVNARHTMVKILCFACLSLNIHTANTIANRPDVSREWVELLDAHFTPLTDEVTSMRNYVLCQYLSFKCFAGGSVEGARPSQSRLLFKKNSTLRVCRNYVDSCLADLEGKEFEATEALSVWPRDFAGFGRVTFRPGKLLPILYRCYK
ncbi:MAG: DUF4190 domain-containing protein [Planctomycetota bacterium]|jgi:hypothetical protein